MSADAVPAFVLGGLLVGLVWFASWLYHQPPPPTLPEESDRERKARLRDRG